MTPEQKLELLDQWEIRMKEIGSHFERVKNLLGLEPESKTLSLVDELQTEYTKLVAEKVGDDGEWLLWHWLENKMGENVFDAEFKDGEKIQVETMVDLLTCIEKSAL
jgi:hypothetical protein